MAPASWKNRLLAMLDNERGHELGLAYMQGRALEMGEGRLRQRGTSMSAKSSKLQRRLVLIDALEATAGHLLAAADLLRKESV